MFCKQCGKQIDDGAVFCQYCGANQQTTDTQPNEVRHLPQQEPNKQPSPKNNILTIIRWVLSIGFIIDGLGLTLTKHILFIFMIAFGLLINPKFNDLYTKVTKKEPLKKGVHIAVSVCCFLMIYVAMGLAISGDDTVQTADSGKEVVTTIETKATEPAVVTTEETTVITTGKTTITTIEETTVTTAEETTVTTTEETTEASTEKPTESPTEKTIESVPSVSMEYTNALKSAQSYSDNLHMSKQGIYDQLTSEYGEGFTEDAAQYAIDNLKADYNSNALKTAESYSDNMHMSKQGIYDQLISEYGEKFTPDEAQYAVDNLNADYNYNALQTAKSYQENMGLSTQEIYDQLVSEYGEKFTPDEAQYAIDNM